jgi:hypothetical protein
MFNVLNITITNILLNLLNFFFSVISIIKDIFSSLDLIVVEILLLPLELILIEWIIDTLIDLIEILKLFNQCILIILLIIVKHFAIVSLFVFILGDLLFEKIRFVYLKVLISSLSQLSEAIFAGRLINRNFVSGF